MKIPRLTSGPWCYTLEEWATRMAISDLTLGIIVAIICFYLSSVVDDVSTTAEVDQDAAAIAKGIFIAVGVIFCLPAVFAIVLIVGLLKANKTLIIIWCYYGMAGVVLFLLFFLALSIGIFIMGNIGIGFLVLAVAAILAGHLIYSVIVVHSIYLKLKDADVTYTSNVETGTNFRGSNSIVPSR